MTPGAKLHMQRTPKRYLQASLRMHGRQFSCEWKNFVQEYNEKVSQRGGEGYMNKHKIKFENKREH